MSMSIGMINGGSSWIQQGNSCLKKDGNGRSDGNNKRKGLFVCSSSSSMGDPYKTLRIKPGATENDVKKAFRKLALQYHPDVCKGSNCGVQFHQINEAYNIVIDNLRGTNTFGEPSSTNAAPEPATTTTKKSTTKKKKVVYEEDLWEEWMGWEGAGIRDYSSHINPYIY